MMQDDENTSNNLLNSALRNGRQLVLSEAGKMVLNETRLNQTTAINPQEKSAFPIIVPVKLKSKSYMPLANLGLKVQPKMPKAKDVHSKVRSFC